MNKFFHTSILLCIGLLMTNIAGAQAFQKGNINVDLGIGFGIYQSSTEISFDFLGQPLTLKDEDGAASFLTPIAFEYGIGEKLGIGAELAFSNYYIDQKDSTEATERVKSVDIAFLVNYHLLESEKNDLMVGLLIGTSGAKWNFEDGNKMTGSGTKFGIYAKDRIFFGEHIGILFQVGYLKYVYKEINTSNDNAILERIDWDLSGWSVGTGLALKF